MVVQHQHVSVTAEQAAVQVNGRAIPDPGRKRCRMHGGAEGIGGQPGNHNALKRGRYTAEAVAQRQAVAVLLRACREQLGAMRNL